MKIYADTSVFGGLFDEQFAEDSRAFFAMIADETHELVVSAIVRKEIDLAPPYVRDLYHDLIGQAEVPDITPEAIRLRDAYLAAGVVTEKSAEDAAHVAMATHLDCRAIASWNFKHITNPDKARQYNDINQLNGYNRLQILKPSEVIGMRISEPETPEPQCVQWKRRAQSALREKLSGMTRDEELAFWREAHAGLLRDRVESEHRLPQLERDLGVKRHHPEFIARLVASIKRKHGLGGGAGAGEAFGDGR